MTTRRTFIAGLGAAAGSNVIWPLAARGQQAAMPVVGFLDSRSPEALVDRLRGFRQGLKDSGYAEGQNLAIEYRWAENQMDRLPELVANLIRRRVGVIVASGGNAVTFAAKAATATIPIVFLAPEDPIALGLVTSLARPGGNLTGINFFNTELAAKQLELLRELVPGAARIAVLVNPSDRYNTEPTLRALDTAASTIGVQIQVLNANTSRDIDAAFEAIARERPDAMFVGQGPFLNSRRVQLVQLAARHAIPAAYSGREFTEIGGLMSYGSDIANAYRQVGVYAGRILKGEKPSDLPVVQASKFEFIINAQTARMLKLAVSPQLLARADEVIE
jgi:putative tryptophan/tyrosine transport system substrate-binding protein